MESIVKTELESRLLALCEQHLSPLGFRAVDVDCRVAGRSLVRLFIERASGEPPTLDDCANASRAIGDILENENLIPGAYDLEVSSPGLDRRLRVRADFEKSVGSDIKLKLTDSVEGLGANVTGKLERVDAAGVIVLTQKKEWPIPLSKIKQANVVWRF